MPLDPLKFQKKLGKKYFLPKLGKSKRLKPNKKLLPKLAPRSLAQVLDQQSYGGEEDDEARIKQVVAKYLAEKAAVERTMQQAKAAGMPEFPPLSRTGPMISNLDLLGMQGRTFGLWSPGISISVKQMMKNRARERGPKPKTE